MSIRNGTVTAIQTGGAVDIFHNMAAVAFFSSARLTVEGLHIQASATAVVGSIGLASPTNSIIRHNILSGTAGPSSGCPSLIEGNVNTTGGAGHGGVGCVFVNNVGAF